MVSVLATGAVNRGFEPRSGQTKEYKIGICCFSPDCCFKELALYVQLRVLFYHHLIEN